MEKLTQEENDFSKYIEKLREMHERKPEKVSNEVRQALIRLGGIEKKSIFQDIDTDKFMLSILIIIIIFVGLFNLQEFPMYLFGVVFFLAGHFVGMFVPIFGLIFLLSHSVTGMGLMIGSLLGEFFTSPIMSDNPKNIFTYLAINAVLYVVATLTVVIHNLSNEFKMRKYAIVLPMAIYTVAFIMSAILPRIVNYIY